MSRCLFQSTETLLKPSFPEEIYKGFTLPPEARGMDHGGHALFYCFGGAAGGF